MSDNFDHDQLRLLVDSVTEYAIFMLDPSGNVVTWNTGAERLKGYTASEIIGKHFSIFYPQTEVERNHPQEELAIATAEGRYEEEGWRVRKDGSRFWGSVVITAIHHADGTLAGFGKVTRDFTERRVAELEVRRSEERFRQLMEGVRDYAIFMLDADGHVISWNEGARRIKGYDAHEIMGSHFSLFYTPEDIAADKPARELAIASAQGRYEEEGWRVRKDGSHFLANVIITALKNENGCVHGFAKVTRDITERVAAEQTRMQTMRDQISRTFLRDILFSVTEGRLRFCENSSELPERLPCVTEDTTFNRVGLADIRSGIVTMGATLGFTSERIVDLVTAASEAAMNAVVHAKQSKYALCCTSKTVQIWITDNGSGIELSTLHRATLERGYTTENSLGHGFWLMLHTCDRLWLNSDSSGTTVVIEQDITPAQPAWLLRPRELSDYLTVDAAD